MWDFQYLATPHLQGACVTVSHQVHGLFRLKGSRKGPAPTTYAASRRADLPPHGVEHVLALASATAKLARDMGNRSAH